MAKRDTRIGDLLANCNLEGTWEADAPLAPRTTFQVGGTADWLVTPASEADLLRVQALALDQGLPLTVLGRGANLLVSDAGVRGVVLAMAGWSGCRLDGEVLRVRAGTDVSEAARFGLAHARGCLEFLNAMPSTVGGAVWMNARCYGAEIADVLEWTKIARGGRLSTVGFQREDWAYKVSPFQTGDVLIVEAGFRTVDRPPEAIRAVMDANEADRHAKGHFRLPCAGSVFKNDHAFGAPSGVIIDRCGLKGLRRGRAVVSEWHANIIVNEGGATASDIRALIDDVKRRVLDQTGFALEEEVLYTGDWSR